MKGLLILIGESFRTGGQGTREKLGKPESFQPQIDACYSHIKFIESIFRFLF